MTGDGVRRIRVVGSPVLHRLGADDGDDQRLGWTVCGIRFLFDVWPRSLPRPRLPRCVGCRFDSRARRISDLAVTASTCGRGSRDGGPSSGAVDPDALAVDPPPGARAAHHSPSGAGDLTVGT